MNTLITAALLALALPASANPDSKSPDDVASDQAKIDALKADIAKDTQDIKDDSKVIAADRAAVRTGFDKYHDAVKQFGGDSPQAPTAVAFVYTRCPVPQACPATVARLGALQERLRGKLARILAVTIDPDHDTVP